MPDLDPPHAHSCLHCGYSMAGLPAGICPECGTLSNSESQVRLAERRARWLLEAWRTAAMLAVAAAILMALLAVSSDTFWGRRLLVQVVCAAAAVGGWAALRRLGPKVGLWPRWRRVALGVAAVPACGAGLVLLVVIVPLVPALFVVAVMPYLLVSEQRRGQGRDADPRVREDSPRTGELPEADFFRCRQTPALFPHRLRYQRQWQDRLR